MAGYNGNIGIITDGLVLLLDAANPVSYPTTGATWNDLSGNRTKGTLFNTPTFVNENAGCIVFDGVNECLTTNTPKNLFTTASQITISITFNLLTFSDVKGILQFANVLNSASPWILIRTNGTNKISWYLNAGYVITHTITPNIFYNITLTYDPTNKWRAYKNGVADGTYAGIFGTIDSNTFYVGNGYNGYSNIKVGNIQIYNRALSQQEIKQNFNALRWRYGI